MAESLLHALGINKYFRDPVDFQALVDVDLAIAEGEFVAIVGESGSGKSTMLYVLATLDTDYEGELYFRSEKISGRPRSQLARLRNEHMGFVFQFHYLLGEFSVLDNVKIPALKRGNIGEAEIEANVMATLAELGVADQASKKANRLSGGQQQRVAIARALINKPAILFGDEPTGNLDSENSARVGDIFRRLVDDSGQTVVVVTHDPLFAARADRIVRMRDGRIAGASAT